MPQSDYLGVNEQQECPYAQKMSKQAFMCFVKPLRFTLLPAIYQITKSIGYKQLKAMFYQQYKMMNSYFRKAAIFLVYVMLLYCCYITSGIYHEKLLKYRYKRSLDQTLENFQAPIIFTLFPSLVSTMIGFVILKISNKNSEEDLHIPMQKSLVASAVINLNMWTYNQAVLSSSFAAAVMVKSCSLLSVILVGVFFSRVKDTQLKLGANKIWIGLMASLGIVLFNYFKITQQDNDRPLNVVGILFLLVSLVGDGILPDLQAQIKSQYKPSAIQMYYSINRSTFIIAIIYAVVSFQLLYIFDFLGSHEEVKMDIFLFSVLNSLGQLVVYQMIKLFKQHIPAFVIATRKCLTVIANLLYFHHQVNRLQIFGIGFVFMAVMMEVYANYQEKMQKEAKDQESSATQMDSQIKYLSNSSKQECEKATIASNNPTE